MDLLHRCANFEQVFNLRALSLSCLANSNNLTKNFLSLQKLDSLVILNLSNLKNVDIELDLQSMNLLNL
jgi:hypothetical protein